MTDSWDSPFRYKGRRVLALGPRVVITPLRSSDRSLFAFFPEHLLPLPHQKMSHSTPKQAMLSPVSPPHLRRDSVTSERAAKPVNTHMLHINNLLNPMNANNHADGSISLRSTPAYTPDDFTSTPTPGPDTPLTPASTKRQKNGKGKAAPKRAASKGVVRYRSYECNSNVICDNPNLRKEIIDQHRHFQVSTEEDGLISDYPKHIPYTSDKKDFHDKTGRDAFECMSPCLLRHGFDWNVSADPLQFSNTLSSCPAMIVERFTESCGITRSASYALRPSSRLSTSQRYVGIHGLSDLI